MNPEDIATQSTLAFVRAHLDAKSRILEVGCGGGALAASLQNLGHDVVAIDGDADAVAAAVRRGVPARRVEFPDLDDEPFHVVLFTRSLHHMRALPAAIEKAKDLLLPRGRLLVEDWGWDRMDRATAAWLYGLIDLCATMGLCGLEEWKVTGDPLENWHEEHRGHVHAEASMLSQVERHFARCQVDSAPYAYRYFCRYLEHHPHGHAIAQKIFEVECALIAAGGILPLGLRIVGGGRADEDGGPLSAGGPLGVV